MAPGAGHGAAAIAWLGEKSWVLLSASEELREAEMVRDLAVLDSVEREMEEQVKERVPGGGVYRVVLLRSGEDPEIERGGPRARRPCDQAG
jgi:hypothetical protein